MANQVKDTEIFMQQVAKNLQDVFSNAAGTIKSSEAMQQIVGNNHVGIIVISQIPKEFVDGELEGGVGIEMEHANLGMGTPEDIGKMMGDFLGTHPMGSQMLSSLMDMYARTKFRNNPAAALREMLNRGMGL